MYVQKNVSMSLSPLDILYARGFLLKVRVMRDSITSWSTRCDLSQQPELCSWLQEWYLLFFVTAHVEIRIVGHIWNMEWPDGVTDSTNIMEFDGVSYRGCLAQVGRTDFGRVNTLGKINFLGRREWSRECFERCSCLEVFLTSVFEKFWW